jgi:hypothetical protein
MINWVGNAYVGHELPPEIKSRLGYPEINRLNLPINKITNYYGETTYQTSIESPPIPSVITFDIKSLGSSREGLHVDTSIADFAPTADPMEGNIFGGNLSIKDRRYTADRDYIPLKEVKSDTELWRGMSGEEWVDIVKRGIICSKGEYNIGDMQKGATYFSEDARQALNYAAGFAPWTLMPTWTKPAVVVRIKRPIDKDLITAMKPEVGIKGCIPISSIGAVYEVRLVSERPGYLDVSVDKYTKSVSIGSRGSPSQSYAIREVPRCEWDSFIKS